MARRKQFSLVSGIAIASSILFAGSTASAGMVSGPFVRGDVNESGIVDIADAVATLAWLFSGGPAPACADAADTNDDGATNLADPVATLAYLFGGGATPIAQPFPDSGYDQTGDALPCDTVNCLPPEFVELALALGSQTISLPTAPVTWSPSVFGIGIMDVTFNLNNSMTAPFGEVNYFPGTGNVTIGSSSFPVGGSLDVDGPLFLDFSCTATITVGMSGSFTLDQEEVSPELILIYGVADTDIQLTLQNISLASCVFTEIIFDAIYPLISSYVNGIVNGTMEAAMNLLAENFLQTQLLGLINPETLAVPVCAP